MSNRGLLSYRVSFQADPTFLARPHADEHLLALAGLLDPAVFELDQVHVNQKLMLNMFVHEEALNMLKRPWDLTKDQPIISACCLLLQRVSQTMRNSQDLHLMFLVLLYDHSSARITACVNASY